MRERNHNITDSALGMPASTLTQYIDRATVVSNPDLPLRERKGRRGGGAGEYSTKFLCLYRNFWWHNQIGIISDFLTTNLLITPFQSYLAIHRSSASNFKGLAFSRI